MQTIRSDGLKGKGITYLPSSGSYSNVLIWLHGLGDTADGWASMMPELKLKDTKFILPTADVRPISLNGGMPMPGWSDIYGLDASSKEDRAGFEASSNRVSQLVQTEIDNGVPANKIVLAGFSQGGAVVLHTALRSPYRLGGCVALSTWIPLRDDYPAVMSESGKFLKVLQVHGDADQVVNYNWGKASHHLLKTLISEPGVEPPQLLTIQGMGHSSDPMELVAVKKFLDFIFTQ